MSVLRELLVGFGFEFDKGSEKEIHGVIEGVKKAALALGAAFTIKEIGDLIVGTVEQVAHLADSMGELSQKVGVNAQALQALGHIAKDNGSSVEGLATGLKFLSKNAVEAKDGSKELHAAFAKMGVSVTDASGQVKPAEELFVQLSDSFAGMTNEAERTAMAQKIFGKSGTELIPTLLLGSKALDEQRKEAVALGLVMSDDLIKAGDAFEKAANNQAGAVQGLSNMFAQELLPTMTEMKIQTTKLIVKVLQPLSRELGKGIAHALNMVRAAFDGVLYILRPLIDGISKLSEGLHTTATLGDIVAAMITGLAALLAAKAVVMAVAWLVANAPLLLTIGLLGLLVLAIGAIIDDFIEMGKGNESVVGTMIQGWKDLVAEFDSIPQAIAEMLKTALDFWFGHESAIRKIFGGLFDWIADQFKTITDIGMRVAGLFGMKGSNIAGVGTTSALAPPPAAGGVNHAGNEVNVTVSGVSDPQKAADYATQGVSNALSSDDLRISGNNYTTAPAQ